MTSKTWETLKKQTVLENDWIRVEKHDALCPSGDSVDYTLVRFKNVAVGCVPIDNEGNIYLVGQWRYTIDQYSWELPEGGADPNKDPIEECARELKEETGITAKSFKHLLTMHTSNSVTDEVAHLYMCIDLEFGEQELDETEDIKVKKLPFEEALKMVMEGEITDSLTVAGILKVAQLTKTFSS